jgi:hypothetical protein
MEQVPEVDAAPPPPPPPATRFTDAELRSLPASGLPEGFSFPEASGGIRYWALCDLDGAGALDLVHSGDTAIADRVWDAAGAPYWKVFRGSAFHMPPMSWTVPSSGQPSDFYAPEEALGFVDDMNGDGYLDLVPTMDPSTSTVWDAAGSSYWKIFKGAP